MAAAAASGGSAPGGGGGVATAAAGPAVLCNYGGDAADAGTAALSFCLSNLDVGGEEEGVPARGWAR